MTHFDPARTCVMLIDVWPLGGWAHGRGEATTVTRQNIARVLTAARAAGIPIWARNSGLPYPDTPPELVTALHGTGLLMDGANQPDETWDHWHENPQEWHTNVVNYEDYPVLVYIGYYLDECVASMASGYLDAATAGHEVIIVKDAGLVNHVCSRLDFKRYPGPCLDETKPSFQLALAAFFCDGIASEVARSLSTDEFEIAVKGDGLL